MIERYYKIILYHQYIDIKLIYLLQDIKIFLK